MDFMPDARAMSCVGETAVCVVWFGKKTNAIVKNGSARVVCTGGAPEPG